MTPDEFDEARSQIMHAVRVYDLPDPLEIRGFLANRPVGIMVNLEDVELWLPVIQEPQGPTIINMLRPVHIVTGRLFGTELKVRVAAEDPTIAVLREFSDIS